jgi:hypothetical protein
MQGLFINVVLSLPIVFERRICMPAMTCSDDRLDRYCDVTMTGSQLTSIGDARGDGAEVSLLEDSRIKTLA